MTTLNCRVCGGILEAQITVREMQLGLREEFDYRACSACGALQIINLPFDLSKYYPAHYGPFNELPPRLQKLPPLKRLVKNIRLKRKYKRGDHHLLNYLSPINTRADAKILDIGCGNGTLICKLYNQGFKNVSGIDKFIPAGIDYGNGVKVEKKDITELESESYDLLMMHHVLEHIEDQQEMLNACFRVLKTGGKLLIWIPVLGEAFKIYGSNWVQLDAPRHIVLHTRKSMELLAARTGFSVTRVIYDSTAFQFTGSELYKRNIAMYDQLTHEINRPELYLSGAEMRYFGEEALLLNREGKGDQAKFYLEKNLKLKD